MSRDLKRGFRSLVSSKVAVSVIGTLSLPLLVRVLGPNGYGDYAFLMSTFSMLMLLVSPAVTEGVQKFVAEDRDSPHWRERVVGFYARLAVLIAVPASLLLAAATWTGVVGAVFDSQLTLLFYLLAVHVLTAQLRTFTRHTLLGLGLEHVSESLSVLKKVVSLGVGLPLAFVGLGVAGLLVGHIVAAVAFVVIGGIALNRELSLTEGLLGRTRSVPVGELLSFNGLNILLVVLMQSLFHADVVMLQFFLGSAQTGVYKAALVLAEYIWLVPIALQRVLLHSASQLWAEGNRDRIQSIASSLTRYVVLLTALLAIGIAVLADSFVPIYFGAAFRATVTPLLVLLPGAVGFAVARPLYGINQASGRLRPLLFALGSTACLNVVLNAALIPAYGTVGAAVATSLSYGSMVVSQVGCALYLGYSPLNDLRPLRVAGAVAVSAPIVFGVDAVVPSPLLALGVVPAIGLAVFTTVVLLFGAVDASELREVATVLPSSLRKRVPRNRSENE